MHVAIRKLKTPLSACTGTRYSTAVLNSNANSKNMIQQANSHAETEFGVACSLLPMFNVATNPHLLLRRASHQYNTLMCTWDSTREEGRTANQTRAEGRLGSSKKKEAHPDPSPGPIPPPQSIASTPSIWGRHGLTTCTRPPSTQENAHRPKRKFDEDKAESKVTLTLKNTTLGTCGGDIPTLCQAVLFPQPRSELKNLTTDYPD